MGLQAAVLVEAHEKQGGVGDEEQRGTDGRGEGGGAGNADPAEDGKAVHGSVDEQIQEHGIEQRLRQVGLEFREDVGHHRNEEHRQKDHQPHGDCGEVHVLQIAEDKEHMADHERDAAGSEPFDALGHQKDIPQPAEDQCQDDEGGGDPGRQHVESQQCQQDKGLGHVPHLFVLFQGCVQMDGGGDDEDRQKHVFHK